MGFRITQEGEPIYTVDMPIISYPKKEKVRDAKTGKILGTRTVTVEHQEPPLIQKPQDKGWFKKITYQNIVLLRVPDPKDHMKIKAKLFLRTFEVDAEKYFTFNPCGHCTLNNHGHRYHFVLGATGSVQAICWACAVHYGRSSMLIKTNEGREGKPSKWCKIISEVPITPQQAVKFCREHSRAIPVNVRMMLSEREGFEVV
jgi:hypothetical protein